LPKFWHQGIRGELLEEAERRMEDSHFTAITLRVFEKNALARRFYEARGFHLDAARKEATIGGLLLAELRYEKRMPNLKPVRSR
jgi:ribosomal protein S18 acetylase RimI-like enzyme